MKRFVLPDLIPAYVLLAMGALIHFLEHSDGTWVQLAVLPLFGVGVWIVFRPQKLIAGARAVSRALLGATRSTGSR
jgi:hypothetical protein